MSISLDFLFYLVSVDNNGMCRREFLIAHYVGHFCLMFICWQMSERELKPRGKTIPVTNESKMEYVEYVNRVTFINVTVFVC